MEVKCKPIFVFLPLFCFFVMNGIQWLTMPSGDFTRNKRKPLRCLLPAKRIKKSVLFYFRLRWAHILELSNRKCTTFGHLCCKLQRDSFVRFLVNYGVIHRDYAAVSAGAFKSSRWMLYTVGRVPQVAITEMVLRQRHTATQMSFDLNGI